MEARINEYVVAINDGYWIQIALGVQSPLDIWAEDSFDENGDPIISYWEINGDEISTQANYDELMLDFFDESKANNVNDFKNVDDIIAEIDSM